jgi:indolepyruvate decarboxylase
MSKKNLTVGGYLGTRLAENGVGHFFTVPGDYNLVLLDEFLKIENWEMISCCNELNAGYAADGYSRATGGLSAVCVTFSVGALSMINAVAGAFAEDLPMIAISGGPNSNSTAEYEHLHHSIGELDYTYVRDMFSHVTAASIIIHDPKMAAEQIDSAIAMALRTRKPVYIEVACNIAACPVSSANPRSFQQGQTSDQSSLAAAVAAVAGLLNNAKAPMLVAGREMRSHSGEHAFSAVAEASGYAVAAMPEAKSFFDETHPSYIGIHWGIAGSPGTSDIVGSVDLALMVGCVFTDYSTAGHTAAVDANRMIEVHPHCVVTPTETFNGITMKDFLQSLAGSLTSNNESLAAWQRIATPRAVVAPGKPDTILTTRQVFSRIQNILEPQSVVLTETGDSWFNGMQLSLPSGSRFEIQMQYGSIGWSVGATLGYAIGAPDRKVISCIGDGSFQLTAQEVSTMIRYGAKPLIFLMNNKGYTIEVEIHDGPYNTIANWKYAELMDVLGGDTGNGRGFKVTTEGELDAAIAEASAHDGPCLVEVILDRDDCSPGLLGWGIQVGKNNSRPPRTAP